jgi:hypothetical protein
MPLCAWVKYLAYIRARSQPELDKASKPVACWWTLGLANSSAPPAGASAAAAAPADEEMQDVLDAQHAVTDGCASSDKLGGFQGMGAEDHATECSEAEALLYLLRTSACSDLKGIEVAGQDALISRAALKEIDSAQRIRLLGALPVPFMQHAGAQVSSVHVSCVLPEPTPVLCVRLYS